MLQLIVLALVELLISTNLYTLREINSHRNYKTFIFFC